MKADTRVAEFEPQTEKLSQRRLKAAAAVGVGVAVSSFPAHAWEVIATIPGAVALTALVRGFARRPALSVWPWALAAAAVIATAAAPRAGSLAPAIHTASLLTVTAAVASTLAQRWSRSIDDEVDMHAKRNLTRPAWGATLVSLAMLGGVLMLQVTS